MQKPKVHGRHMELSRIANLVILLALMVVATIVNPAFLTPANLLGILEQNAAKGIMALGITFILITGGIDLSMETGLTMVAVVASIIHFNTGAHIVVLVLMCLVIGGLMGMVNGFLVSKIKLLPFVATLGMMSIASGVTYGVSEGKLMFLEESVTNFIGRGKLMGGIPFQSLVFAGMAVLAAVILYRTSMGVVIYALGSNESAAEYCGINTSLQKFKVYVLEGLFIGVAALLTVTRVGQISPNLGSGTQMDAIAAAVIGGTSTMGGRGTVMGTVIGVLIMGVLTNALTFMSVPVNAQSAIKGAVILIAIVFDAVFSKLRDNKE